MLQIAYPTFVSWKHDFFCLNPIWCIKLKVCLILSPWFGCMKLNHWFSCISKKVFWEGLSNAGTIVFQSSCLKSKFYHSFCCLALPQWRRTHIWGKVLLWMSNIFKSSLSLLIGELRPPPLSQIEPIMVIKSLLILLDVHVMVSNWICKRQ